MELTTDEKVAIVMACNRAIIKAESVASPSPIGRTNAALLKSAVAKLQISEPTVFINDIEVTALQAESIFEVYRRPIDGEKLSFEKFTEGLTPMVFGDGAVVLPWCNMFLAIETDGHVHS